MRLFVVLSPMLTNLKPGQMVTGDALFRDGKATDEGLDRCVERGFVTEVFYDIPTAPFVESDVVDEHPARNASRVDWADYAAVRGVDVDGLGRDDIVELFLGDDED